MAAEARLSEEFEHEKMTVFRDPATEATGAIAIHSTVLGPSMGGLRLSRYPDLSTAILDGLRLSRAMTLKCAAAGLDLGGGKAVLIDDGRWDEARDARMKAVGAAIEAMGGEYITAEDVGTKPSDMDSIGSVTRHVAGGSRSHGGSGDPSPYTARTVFAAIELAVQIRLGRALSDGVRVGVQGVGNVGAALVGLLREAGASVFVTDIDAARCAQVAETFDARVLPLDGFIGADLDVFAPCALGGAIRAEDVPGITASIVAGGANNPLAGLEVAPLLAAADTLYVPDFIANCGGIIHVGAEPLGLPGGEVAALIAAAIERTERILLEAHETGRLPLETAERYALDRIGRSAMSVV